MTHPVLLEDHYIFIDDAASILDETPQALLKRGASGMIKVYAKLDYHRWAARHTLVTSKADGEDCETITESRREAPRRLLSDQYQCLTPDDLAYILVNKDYPVLTLNYGRSSVQKDGRLITETTWDTLVESTCTEDSDDPEFAIMADDSHSDFPNTQDQDTERFIPLPDNTILPKLDKLRLYFSELEILDILSLRQAVRDAALPTNQADPSPEITPPPPPSPPPENRIYRNGDYYLVTFNGITQTLSSSHGLRYIDYLLKNQGREIPVGELSGVTSQQLAPTAGQDMLFSLTSEQLDELGLSSQYAFGKDALVDTRTEVDLKKEIQLLKDKMEDAIALGEPKNAAVLKSKMDPLVKYIATSKGLGGKPRFASDEIEKTRKRITKCISASIQRLGKDFPEFATHLAVVKTGAFCHYTPTPKINWKFSAM